MNKQILANKDQRVCFIGILEVFKKLGLKLSSVLYIAIRP